MDENPDVITGFELLLKQHSTSRPPPLYKDKTNGDSTVPAANLELNAQAIISNVAKHIKAIQSSETVRNYRKPTSSGNSHLMPLCKLQEQKMLAAPQDHKFETQLFSNTQLISIVESVEALENNSGMTQEFETKFCHGDMDDDDVPDTAVQENPVFPILDISLKEPDKSKSQTQKEDKNFEQIHENVREYPETDHQIDATQILKQCIEVKDIDLIEADNLQQDLPLSQQDFSQRPLSPVFNVKTKKTKSDPLSPIVCDLAAFENFEKIALPVILEVPDNEQAKHLINSQILSNELILQTSMENVIQNMDAIRLNNLNFNPASPIIDITDVPLQVDRKLIIENVCTDHKDIKTDVYNNKDAVENSQSDQSVFKDEILFSSDEEDDYLQQSYKDLPFTCALETSFYDTCEVLDKTMYVGFQTASNKSIQIETESFSKAKSFLDSVEQEFQNEATLTELVKIFDSSKKAEANIKDDLDLGINCEENVDKLYDISLQKENTLDFEPPVNSNKVPVNRNEQNSQDDSQPGNILWKALTNPDNRFQGFKTASNNTIHFSEQAVEKSKTLFHDIDLVENLEFLVETPKKSEMGEEVADKIEYNDGILKKNSDQKMSKEENIENEVIQEFEDDLMNTELEDIILNLEQSKDSKVALSTELKKPVHDNVEFIGFKTASNKNIRISDAALAKSSKVFQDIEKEDVKMIVKHNHKEINAIPSNNVGFKTASNKCIKISEEALTKTEHVFKDIDVNNRTNSFKAENLQIKDISQPSTRENIAVEISNNKEVGTKEKFVKEEDTKVKNDSDKTSPERKEILNNIHEDFVIHSDDDFEPFYGFDNTDMYIESVKETLLRSQKIIERLTYGSNQDTDSANVKSYGDDDKKAVSANLGFRTASDKEIKISEEALGESLKIFNDITDRKIINVYVSPNDHDIGNPKFHFGFKTASKKEIKVSEKSLSKSREIFQELKDLAIESQYMTNQEVQERQMASNEQIKTSKEAINKDDGCRDLNTRAETKSTFQGFLTASNKRIEISEDAFAKSNEIFKDIDESKTTDTHTINSAFQGFQTASNKKVIISEKTLAKSRKIFDDISENKPEKTNSNSDNKFKGFLTASNKEVKISEEALARSKNIFHDIEETIVDKNTNILEDDSKNVDTGFKFQGFQTASNKSVQISAEALAKSKQLFQDIDSDLKTNNKMDSFKTASNRNIKISEQALAKSRKLFQDLTDNDPVETGISYLNKEPSTLNPVSKFEGFQTASNKKISISSEALAKSKMIFQEITEDKALEIEPKNEVSALKFDGFKTASHKQVKISKEALDKSRKILEDVEIDQAKAFNKDTNKVYTDIQFKGLQTANNKNVAISKEAIAQSRKMFQDLDVNFEKTDTTHIKTPKAATFSKFEGFKTACNDKVQVSEEALMQSKKLLAGNKNNSDTEKCSTKVGLQNNDSGEIIDTQILNNFEVSMHENTPKKSKRSGSPILSCPKSKKRKIFQIPYSQKSPQKPTYSDFRPPTIQKQENPYSFCQSYKKTKKYTLKDIQNFEKSSTSQEIVDIYIQNLNFENLLEFQFPDTRNDVTNSILNIPELKNIFTNSVNKKFLPDGWLEIQIKLIMWKLISYEMKFPKIMSKMWTARNVLEQLKYRYDKELYNAERPALRKIFERDDTPAKTLVLCVVAVYKTEQTSDSTPELLLSDGWYTIRAVIDKMLARLVENGKITVGTKLVTTGAELVGSEQAASPWEDTSSIRLKIFGNSTRRARWDARLGYHGNAAILSRLSTVALDGGKISKLRAYITRVYPTLYVDKFEDGSTVTRSERLEHIHQMKYENERQALLEKIYEEVEKELLDQDLTDSGDVIECGVKRKSLDSGSQIAKMMKRSRDPGEFRSTLTSTQITLLEDHTAKEREKLLQNIQTKVQDKMAARGLNVNRNVVTLLKIRLAAVEKAKTEVKITKALLSIWRPNDAVIELIKEGIWIEVLNVVPTAMRYSELQISAGRQSVFSQLKYQEDDKVKPHILSLKRTCYPIKDLVKNPAMTTDYNEIDTVGVIFEIDPKLKDFNPNQHQFQNIYLTDAEKNIISINFWGGLKKFGFENVLDTGQIVACTNLQKRAGNSRKNIPQYRVTEFSYFTKTPKSETARKIIEELYQEFIKINKEAFFKECVGLKNANPNKLQVTENVTPYRISNVDMNLSKNKMFIDSPLEHQNKKDENLNLTGLDFESTFRQTDSQDLSPKTLLRKQQVKEKIAKLKRYGEPPPISPMLIINKSKNAAHAFKSPLMSKSDIPNSVASSEKILPNWEEKCNDGIQCSPVINLNRTYVKRTNPVKLNFSKIENSLNEDVDGFDEDFDCSLPLSLD